MRNGRIVEWDIDNMHSSRIVDNSGNVRWYADGQLHRTDGPAVEYAHGDCFWYVNNQLHRIDGPAIEFANGTCEWYLRHTRYTFTNWCNALNTTPETRTLLMLKWSSHA